ncbi:MAG: Outer membrane protein OprM precursor [Verrucomicrobia bacterium ADurb.Bin345]|nr:MAG: Outer membrane protein OprM precursor [Verrucomicrobia bacterium ADurb.Bin345]
MKSRSSFFALLAAVVLVLGAGAESPTPEPVRMTLEDAIAMALDTSEDVRLAEIGYEQTSLLRDRAKTLMKPDIAADASRTWPRDTAGRWNEAADPTDRASIGLTQPLFNTDAYTTFRGSRYLVSAAQFQKEFAVEGALFGVAEVFLSFLQAQSSLDTARETLKLAREQLDATRTRYEAGHAPKTDYLRAETEVSRAERNLERVQNRLVSERLNLARLVGLGDRPFTAVAPDDFKQYPFDGAEPPQELMDTAMAKRKDLEQLRNDIQVAEWTLRQARYSLLPTLDVNVNQSWIEPETSSQPSDYWTASVRAHLPLFEGGKRTLDIKEARFGLEQARLALERQEKLVEQQVADAWLAGKTAKAHLAAFESELKLAEETYEVTKQQYSSGQVTSLDLIDAFTQLTLARANHATQTFQYYQSVLALFRELGRFGEYIPKEQEGDRS